MRAVIIAGSASDMHASLIRTELDRRKVEIAELTLGMAASQIELTGSLTDPVLITPYGEFRAETFTDATTFMLRFAVNSPDMLRENGSEFARREWNSLIHSAFAIWERCSSRPWLFSGRSASLIDRKIELLALANELGANIPASQLATRLEKGSLEPGHWVAKAINVWEEVSPGRFLNTHLLDASDTIALEGTRLDGPLAIQEYIAHDRELRVFVVGPEAFAVEIIRNQRSVLDFRLLKANSASVRVVAVDSHFLGIARQLMLALDLNYCVFDVIDDGSHEWLLIDINPLGTWDYLEKEFEMSLTERIVNGALNL